MTSRSRSAAIAVAALTAGVVLVLVAFDRAVEVDPFLARAHEPMGPPVPPELHAAPVPSIDLVERTVDRDPFHPGRRARAKRYRLPAGDTTAEPRVIGDNVRAGALTLIGTVMMPDDGFAMCRLGDEPAEVIRVGDSIGGLTLEAVEQASAVFVAADGSTRRIRIPEPGT